MKGVKTIFTDPMYGLFLVQVSEPVAIGLIEAFQENAKSLEQFPERNPGLTDPLISSGQYPKALVGKTVSTGLSDQGKYGVCRCNCRYSTELGLADVSLGRCVVHMLNRHSERCRFFWSLSEPRIY